MNSFESPKNVHNEESHKETPVRFRLAVEAMLKANFKNIEVIGENNLKKLPKDAKVIIATTHISDYDVVIPISKLGKHFRIKAVGASILKEDWISNMGINIAGKENILPVDMHYGNHEEAGKSYYASSFNTNNFVPMKKSLEDGDTIVIAAYTPTPIKDGKLSDKGGFGAVYLSEISGAYILPVAINIKSNDPNIGTRKSPMSALLNRPEAQMIIGEPFLPENTNPELGVRDIRKSLQSQSDKLMTSLAHLLPPEKRGDWK